MEKSKEKAPMWMKLALMISLMANVSLFLAVRDTYQAFLRCINITTGG